MLIEHMIPLNHISEIEATLTTEMAPFKTAELGWIMS